MDGPYGRGLSSGLWRPGHAGAPLRSGRAECACITSCSIAAAWLGATSGGGLGTPPWEAMRSGDAQRPWGDPGTPGSGPSAGAPWGDPGTPGSGPSGAGAPWGDPGTPGSGGGGATLGGVVPGIGSGTPSIGSCSSGGRRAAASRNGPGGGMPGGGPGIGTRVDGWPDWCSSAPMRGTGGPPAGAGGTADGSDTLESARPYVASGEPSSVLTLLKYRRVPGGGGVTIEATWRGEACGDPGSGGKPAGGVGETPPCRWRS